MGCLPDRMSSRFEPWFVLFMTGSIGLGMVGMGAISIVTYHSHLSNAEPVEATIVHSGVTTKYTGPGQREEPNVVYEYRYDGDVRRGEGVYAGIGPATMPVVRSSRSVAERYEEGETVTAYVVDSGDGRYYPTTRISSARGRATTPTTR